MPRLSDSMEEGTVLQWLVEIGERVERGQPLVEIDTDKATMEYEAETGGTILEILVREGESARIGAPIARFGAAEGVARPPAPSAPAPPREARVNASPVARRLAAELGVDLGSLEGSGPGGQVTKEDVERAAGASRPELVRQPGAKGEVQLQELTRLQQAVARRMVEGASAPAFAVEVEIDMSAVVALRGGLGVSAPSLNDFVVKAAALALCEFPRLNASYTERGFELYSRVNVGIAVAGDDALLVPTIFDADSKSVADISAESRELSAKVREGSITPAELDGGTSTVTNLGMFGASRFLPIINPPQAGILAVGAVTKRPVIDENGSVVARETMNATLVSDHRIVYGAEAACFLGRVRELLEQPDSLL